MHGAEHRPAVVFEADQRAPHRQAGDEGARPVDRIEHPDVFGILTFAAVFLPEDAVVGIALADHPSHRLLRRLVGDGDGIEGLTGELVLDLEPRAEPRQDRPAGGIGQLVEEGGELVGGRGGAHSDLVTS